VNPLNSFQLKHVGINFDITPRVTLEGDILIDLNLESSTQGPDVNVAGTNYPSFGTRKVSTRLRLRDGESNLLAGLLREDERKSLSGMPGAIHVPVLRQLFSSNDQTIQQTDIVMLLTPRIIRTNEVTEEDLRPIYIGSQQNLGVGGPPPLIAAAPEPAATVPAGPAATPGASTPRPPNFAPGAPPTPLAPVPSGATLAFPAGSTPVPGTVLVPTQPGQPAVPAGQPSPNPAAVPAAAPPAPPPAAPPPEPAAPSPAPPPSPAAAPPQPAPITTPGIGLAQVLVSPPGTTFRVGAGPYTVPISIVNASRLSMITLTLTFDPMLLRVRAVNEGSFMRSGGAAATFVNQVAPGRVDITITRSADATGASGTGLLGAVLFDAIAAGPATLTTSGSGTGPGGTAMGLQFRPVTITVQQ